MEKTTFYVVSYGGSGSYMIMRYLQSLNYKVFHIHSRNRPKKLVHVGGKNSNGTPIYFEWFNDIIIPENEVSNFKVIFVYRDPVKAIYSRYNNPRHLKNIQCINTNTKIKDVIETKKDLYGIEEFFDNYASSAPKNYKIFFVKYEEFFKKIPEFNKTMDIPNIPQKYPKENVTKRDLIYYKELQVIYKPLIDKMNKFNFIEVI